jgi:hypothetical protein
MVLCCACHITRGHVLVFPDVIVIMHLSFDIHGVFLLSFEVQARKRLLWVQIQTVMRLGLQRPMMAINCRYRYAFINPGLKTEI